MPGGLHAPTAEALPKGTVQVSTLAGLGRRTGLLGEDHKFNRAIGDLAVAYGVTQNISVALSLDGRYDRHWGNPPSDAMTMKTATNWGASGEDGYVGDPKLIVRAATSTGSVAFGGQLGIWVPGRNAPSIAASAISVDARGLVSLPAGPGLLSFSGGFRLDNSANSIEQANRLTLQDRVTLGVSDYHALFTTAQLRMPAGDKVWIAIEGSLDAFIGGPLASDQVDVQRAELRRSTLVLRAGVTGGVHINTSLSAVAFLETSHVPGVDLAQVYDGNIPLIPYEPIVTGGVGLQARFGGSTVVRPLFVEKSCKKRGDCPAIKVAVTTAITGTVIDGNGKPVVGSKVLLTLKNSEVEPTTTDENGTYLFKGVRIGESVEDKETLDETAVEISVDLSGMKPGKAVIARVTKETNTVPPITLEPVLVPGELRGIVRSLRGGKAVQGATIVVDPGGMKLESQADGTFQGNLDPGQYKIKVSASGFRLQELDVTIEPNGVAIKNIDLQ